MGSGLKALIVFTCLTLIAGIGYLVYRASQPTIEDAVRDVVESQYDPAVLDSMMKGDLQNFTVAQEAFFAESRRYTTNLDWLSAEMARYHGRIFPSPGVKIWIERAGYVGYLARATHPGSKKECVIYLGPDSVYGLPPARAQGVPACASPGGR
jgi:hypothetical protein